MKKLILDKYPSLNGWKIILLLVTLLYLSGVFPEPLSAQPALLFDEANFYFVQEKYEQAIEKYEQFIQQYPIHPHRGIAQFLIGKAYVKLNFTEQAEHSFRTIEQIDPHSEWIDDSLLQIAEIKTRHFSKKQLTQAIAIYREILERFPEGDCMFPARYGLGKMYFQLGEWKEAEKNLLLILELNPPDQLAVEVLITLGDFYRTKINPLFNPQQAITRYNQILERYPKNAPLPTVYLALGHAYRDLNQYGEALAFFQKIVHEYPDSFQSPLAQSMIGLCYEERQKVDNSLTVYQDIVKTSAPVILKETVSSRENKIKRLQKGTMQIEADEISYDADKGKGYYQGNVHIFWEDCVVTCRKATAYTKKSYLVAEGDVKCQSRIDLKLSGTQFHLFPKQRKAKLYGDAKVIFLNPALQEEQVLATGNAISYDFATDRYVLDN